MSLNRFYQDLHFLTRLEKTFLLRLMACGIGLCVLIWLMLLLCIGHTPSFSRKLYCWAGLTVSTPLVYFSTLPILRSLYIRYTPYFTVDLSLLITLIATYAYSAYGVVICVGDCHAYFDSVLLLFCILYIGRYLEVTAIQSVSKRANELQSLPAKRVTVHRADHAEHDVELKDIAINDILHISPGDYIPVDGIIYEGDTSVDESMLTGEALAIPKFAHDLVRAGTYNLDKAIVIRANSTFEQSYLGKMLSSVKGAQLYKYQNAFPMDQFYLWYQIIAFSVAFAIYCWWLPHDLEFALLCMISTLLITCPCVIGSSFPLVIASILHACAKKGIYVKNASAFLQLSHVQHILFDKTGTLTEGNLIVTRIEFLNNATQDEYLPLIASIEKHTHHPIAHAITAYAEKIYSQLPNVTLSRLRVFPGKGLRTLVNNQFILIGSAQWLKKNGVFISAEVIADQEKKMQTSHYLFVHCAIGGVEVARIELKDRIRPNSAALISRLKRRNLDLTILSGDQPAIVNAVAKQIGPISVSAHAFPQKKESHVSMLQNQGQIVAMIGDGLNDALALRQADVGIAMGSGDPITIFCADIILATPDISLLEECILLSQKAQKILKQNYALALLFTLIALPFAAVGELSPIVVLCVLCACTATIALNTTRI